MTTGKTLWGDDAPSIHDSKVMALRSECDLVVLDVQLDEDQGWATIHIEFAFTGDRDTSWGELETILRAGAEPELMVLKVSGGETQLGISIEPEVNGIRWLDVRERTSSVLYSREPL